MSATGIYGLSGSGIDVDSMVRVGMMSKQNEYDRMYKKEVRQEWLKEKYADTYSDISKFANTTMSAYKMSATLNPQTVSSTNSSYVTATANADAAPMTHTVEVEQMASNAYLLSDKITRQSSTNTSSLYLSDFISSDNLGENGLSFTVSDGEKKATISFSRDKIYSSKETLNDLAAAFNNAGLNIKASYDSRNDAFTLYNTVGGSENGIYLTAAVFDENGDYKSYDKAAEQLLNHLDLHTVTVQDDGSSKFSDAAITLPGEVNYGQDNISIVNGKKTTTATVTDTAPWTASTATDGSNVITLSDGGSQSISVTADGSTATFTINGAPVTGKYSVDPDTHAGVFSYTETAGNTTTTHQFSIGSDNSVTAKTITETVDDDVTYGGMSGQDAIVKIDGKEYKGSTNKVMASNVTYTILGKGNATLTVSQDTEKLVDNVKKFVDDYNEMLDKLNDMYNEQKYSDYDVLTESQKKGMTQEQIDKWEEKAKSGLFYHNKEIGKLISDLREAIYTPVDSVDGKYKTMMSVGIESQTDRGHLRIDEDKLRKALADDPDAIYQLLGASGEKTRTLPDGKTETYTDFGSEGIANRIYDKSLSAMKSIKSYAGTSAEVSDGSSLGDLIRNMQQKMSDFKTMMNAFENKLYKRYDAMEIAIQRLGVSLGYITGGQ